jgi:hypothetical protein
MAILQSSPVLSEQVAEPGCDLVNVFFRFIDGKVCSYANGELYTVNCSSMSMLLEY